MDYRGFCGPSNPSQAVIADCERTVNWYLEQIQSPEAPTSAALYPTPGFQAFLTATESGYRGGWAGDGRAFVAVGMKFLEVFETGSTIVRGSLALDNNPVTIAHNGTGGQLLITAGGNGYCYTLATNVLTQVAALNGVSTMAGAINNRFLVFNAATGLIKVSDLNDGTTYGAAMFFSRQGADPAVSMITNREEIWIIGEQTGEVWYDAGNFPQPFAPISGATFSVGIAARFSLGVAGDYITWITQKKGGAGTVVAAKGYNPQPISNFAVETAIASYLRTQLTISNAEVLVYEDQGHLFANFSFPASDATWTFDVSTGAWHERGTFDPINGRFAIWHPRVHLFAFGKHLVGGRDSAILAHMDVSLGGDLSARPLRRLRIPPPLWARPSERLVVSRFELMVETGLGLTTGQGSDPKVMFRVSPDGRTWGTEREASVGKMGDYRRRCVWLRCGSSDRLWVPEITVSDPIPWRVAGAMVEGSGIRQGAR